MLALAVSLALLAAPPKAGVLVPGQSLGGLRLGMTQAQVTRAWGADYGRCQNCTRPTRYYTYKAFTSQGAAVVFERGRVSAVFTLWSPPGWRTTRGLRLGEAAARIATVYGALLQVRCGTYSAFVLERGGTRTSFYVYDEKVWGFGLSSAAAPACP